MRRTGRKAKHAQKIPLPAGYHIRVRTLYTFLVVSLVMCLTWALMILFSSSEDPGVEAYLEREQRLLYTDEPSPELSGILKKYKELGEVKVPDQLSHYLESSSGDLNMAPVAAGMQPNGETE